MPNSDCDSKLSLETQKYPLTVRPSKMSPQWQLSSKTTVVFKGKKVCPHKYSCTKHTHAQTNKCMCLCFPLPLSLLGVQRTRVSWSRGGAELSELVREPNLRDYRPSTDPLQTLRFSSLCCHWGDTLIFYMWTTETDSFFIFLFLTSCWPECLKIWGTVTVRLTNTTHLNPRVLFLSSVFLAWFSPSDVRGVLPTDSYIIDLKFNFTKCVLEQMLLKAYIQYYSVRNVSKSRIFQVLRDTRPNLLKL